MAPWDQAVLKRPSLGNQASPARAPEAWRPWSRALEGSESFLQPGWAARPYAREGGHLSRGSLSSLTLRPGRAPMAGPFAGVWPPCPLPWFAHLDHGNNEANTDTAPAPCQMHPEHFPRICLLQHAIAAILPRPPLTGTGWVGPVGGGALRGGIPHQGSPCDLCHHVCGCRGPTAH